MIKLLHFKSKEMPNPVYILRTRTFGLSFNEVFHEKHIKFDKNPIHFNLLLTLSAWYFLILVKPFK